MGMLVQWEALSETYKWDESNSVYLIKSALTTLVDGGDFSDNMAEKQKKKVRDNLRRFKLGLIEEVRRRNIEESQAEEQRQKNTFNEAQQAEEVRRRESSEKKVASLIE